MRVSRLWPMRNTAQGASGSFREGSSAGNSHPDAALVAMFFDWLTRWLTRAAA